MTRNLLAFVFMLCLVLPGNVFAVSVSRSETELAKEVSNEPAIGAIQDAMKEFRELSKKEKKSRLKEVKKELKKYKAQKRAGEISESTLLLVLLAILVPPLAVYLHEGEINTRFWISLILTILGFVLFGSLGAIFMGSLLGIIYALYIVLAT